MKRTLDDLALFGGSPAFQELLHVGRPNIGDEVLLLGRIRDVIKRRWLTNGGPCVQEFEQRIAETVGVRHCIAVCNATIALEIVIRALGMHCSGMKLPHWSATLIRRRTRSILHAWRSSSRRAHPVLLVCTFGGARAMSRRSRRLPAGTDSHSSSTRRMPSAARGAIA